VLARRPHDRRHRHPRRAPPHGGRPRLDPLQAPAPLAGAGPGGAGPRRGLSRLAQGDGQRGQAQQPPAITVLRTPRPGRRMLPSNALAVMPTLTAVEMPAAARSALPGATWSTRLARAVVRARTTARTGRPGRPPRTASHQGPEAEESRGLSRHRDEHRRPRPAVDQHSTGGNPDHARHPRTPAAAARLWPPGNRPTSVRKNGMLLGDTYADVFECMC